MIKQKFDVIPFAFQISETLSSVICYCFHVNFSSTLQMMKKDDIINQLQTDLQECKKELTIAGGILPKVSEERDLMWEEIKQYSEKNMLLNSEINMLKKKIETLDEDILMKEGQITILKDTIGKPFDLLASPDSTRDFLLALSMIHIELKEFKLNDDSRNLEEFGMQ